jgi:RNA polymerase sigma-70 factor (TIGR02960 family)
VPYEAGPAAELGVRPQPPADLPWLQPYPDRLLDEGLEPGDAVVARETIELAFLAAIQHLPPRQRAVLILRDALDWPADDTAAVLEMSLAAVNSALQRARATLKERLPAARVEWARAADAEQEERSILKAYVEAFERHDDSQLVALLREDVRLAMPPHPTWYEGREAIAAFLARVAFPPESEAHRFVPTRANRQPAFGVYRGEGAEARPFAINVVVIVRPRSEHALLQVPGAFPRLRAPRHSRPTVTNGVGDALFRVPLPQGFVKCVFRAPPGLELDMEPMCLPDAIVVVEQGELELECRAGTRRRFGPGSMIPIACLPVSRLRSAGPDPLVVVAVSRAATPAGAPASSDRRVCGLE